MLLDLITQAVENYGLINGTTDIIPEILEKALARSREPYKKFEGFRGSSLGKPWIVQILNRWHPEERDDGFSIQSLKRMCDGIVCQSWLEKILEKVGLSYESEVFLSMPKFPIPVIGHADLVVSLGDEIVVVECKSMAQHIFTRFKETPTDDNGYVTQLCYYTECVKRTNPSKRVRGVFALFNRSDQTFCITSPSDEVYAQKLQRVSIAASKITSIPEGDYELLLDTVQIPPIVDPKYLPGSIRYSRWHQFFYMFSDREYYPLTKEESLYRLREFANGARIF